MKISEFRKLIREEVRKIVSEVQSSDWDKYFWDKYDSINLKDVKPKMAVQIQFIPGSSITKIIRDRRGVDGIVTKITKTSLTLVRSVGGKEVEIPLSDINAKGVYEYPLLNSPKGIKFKKEWDTAQAKRTSDPSLGMDYQNSRDRPRSGNGFGEKGIGQL